MTSTLYTSKLNSKCSCCFQKYSC